MWVNVTSSEMGNWMSSEKLKVRKMEQLQTNTNAYMLDNGTIFYYHCSIPTSLYVKWRGEKVEANLPSSAIHNIVGYGNSIYFIAVDLHEIYRATLTGKGTIDVSQVRKLHNRVSNYLIDRSTFYCTRIRDEKKLVYRMWENAEKDGVLIDVHKDILKKMKLIGIHRKKAIFVHKSSDRTVTARRISVNVIVIYASTSFKIHSICRDSFQYFYLFFDHRLYALNTETIELLHKLCLDWYMFTPVGISHGKSEEVVFRDCIYLKSARLPSGFFKQSTTNLQIAEFRRRNGPYNDVTFTSEYFMSWILPNDSVGAGAFGYILKVSHRAHNRNYALKMLAVKSGAELKKTLSEVLRMRILHHPGIVRYKNAWLENLSHEKQLSLAGWMTNFEEFFHQSLTEGNGLFLFIQMELCKESLAEWLSKNMDFRSHDQMKLWFKQIISALEYIHSKKIFHRDLKPSNILIDSERCVKICDLGIATDCILENGEKWRTNIGSELYKAPEQSFFYDERVDIFSSGLILLEMCAVMTDELKIQAFNDIRSGRQLKVLQGVPTTQDLVMKLTKLDPDQRPNFEEINSHAFFSDSILKQIIIDEFSSYEINCR